MSGGPREWHDLPAEGIRGGGRGVSTRGLLYPRPLEAPAPPAPPPPASDVDARPDRALWLLDVELGGRVWRWSTRRVEVPTAAGEVLVYSEGLEDLAWSMERVDALGDAELGVVIHADVDWPRMEAAGVPLDGQACLLRRWVPGTVIEEARVALRGLTEAWEYDIPGTAAAVTLAQSARALTRELPDLRWRADEATWPVRSDVAFEVDEQILGASYPVVIGHPGTWSTGIARPTVSALLVEGYAPGVSAARALVAAGHVHAGAVRLYSESREETVDARAPTIHTEDRLGQPVTMVELGALPSDHWGVGNRIYVGYQAAGDYGGGVLNRLRTGPLRGLAEVFAWVMDHSGMAVDRARLAAHAAQLDSYLIDAWLAEPTNLIDWFRGEVLGIYPIDVVDGPDGVYLRPWRYDATARDAVAHLSVDRGHLQRAGTVTRRDWPIYNRITLEYAPAGASGRYLLQRTIAAEADLAAGVLASRRCGLSQRALQGRSPRPEHGVRAHRIQSAVTWSTSTATAILEGWAARHATRKRAALYVGDPGLRQLAQGSVVTITDEMRSLYRHPCIVEDIQEGGGQVALDVTLLDDLDRVPLVTGG